MYKISRMKKFTLFFALFIASASWSQKSLLDTIYQDAAYVDFDAYMELAWQAREQRKTRLISLDTFQLFSRDENTVILDTRSKEMYDARHIKGAIHLDFSDFTQLRLSQIIPDTNTRILIYCNNNFENDDFYFPTKSISPQERDIMEMQALPNGPKQFPLTMALNIPTYINLFGYGYKNVFELSDLVSIYYGNVEFEGTAKL